MVRGRRRLEVPTGGARAVSEAYKRPPTGGVGGCVDGGRCTLGAVRYAGLLSFYYPAVGLSHCYHVAVIYCHSDGIRYPGSPVLYTSPSPRDKRQSRMPSSA